MLFKQFAIINSEKSLFVSSSILANFVICGDIKKGFVFYTLEEIDENNQKKYRLKQKCQETLSSSPGFDNQLFRFNDDTRVVSNDPLNKKLLIFRILTKNSLIKIKIIKIIYTVFILICLKHFSICSN